MAAAKPAEPLTAAQLQAHPEYPYVNWDLVPSKKGEVSAGAGRGGPFKISYEIHGTGPIHLVWIMGLGGIKSTWQRQTKDFGHTEGEKYSCLILDNRGIGESDKPLLRYSTSEMAEDVREVLDHIGWTKKRDLHLLGISMGGMIVQELAFAIPERVSSLSLISTAAALKNTVGFFENLYNRAWLFAPKSIDAQLAGIKYNVYTDKFLSRPDELEYTKEPYPTNGDRIAAAELIKRLDPKVFVRHGFILQAIAAGWHHKSPEQLARLTSLIGGNRIMVIHGTRDRMIPFIHGKELLEGLGGTKAGITVHFEEGQGHVVPIEMRKPFVGWVKELIERAESLSAKE